MASSAKPSTSRNGISNFLTEYHIHELLDGGGRFGRLLKVTKKANDKVYTLKVLKEYEHASLETFKTCLDRLKSVIMPHDGIVEHYENFIESMSEDDHDAVEELLNGGKPSEHRKFFVFEPNLPTPRMLFMVTEPCTCDLRQYMKQPEAGEFWSMTWCLSMMKQMALGLQHMHRLGVLHGYLKPENVFLAGEGYPPGLIKISNFGAHAFDGTIYIFDPDGDLCPYIAPEQAITENYGHEADWFALGIISFELLTFPQLHPTEEKPDEQPLRLAIKRLRKEKSLPEMGHLQNPNVRQVLFGLTQTSPARRMNLDIMLSLIDSVIMP